MLITKRIPSLVTWTLTFCGCLFPVLAPGPAHAQFTTFTNSLANNVNDPGVVFLPGAGSNGLYIGGQTTPNGNFYLFMSPNLEDLFLQPLNGPNVYDMSTYASHVAHTPGVVFPGADRHRQWIYRPVFKPLRCQHTVVRARLSQLRSLAGRAVHGVWGQLQRAAEQPRSGAEPMRRRKRSRGEDGDGRQRRNVTWSERRFHQLTGSRDDEP